MAPRRLASILALAVIIIGCGGDPMADGAVRIGEAGFLQSASEIPPDPAAFRERTVTFPDVWRQRRAAGAEGWYRAVWQLDTLPDRSSAIYLPRVGMNAAVWVNGRFVGDGGPMSPPIARNWNRPLLFSLPAALLQVGSNEVMARLVQVPQAPPYLATIIAGPEHVLRPVYERRLFLQVTLGQIGFLSTLLMAFLVGVIFLRRDPTGGYRWFFATLLVWSYSGHGAFLTIPPIAADRLWDWSTTTANCITPIGLVIAVHRLRREHRPRLEAALVGFGALMALGLALVSPFWVFYWQAAWMSVAWLASLYLLKHLIAPLREHASPHIRLPPIVGSAVAFVIGLHDFVTMAFARTVDEPLLLGLIPTVVMVGIGWALIARLAEGLSESERLTGELEDRVRRKGEALERSYARAGDLEREGAVADERERIMRDMHDGMGGQLVSTLAMVESGASGQAVAGALREALDEMRTVIDSLDPGDGDLGEVLAIVRTRYEPRLAANGIRLVWGITDLPELAWLGPEQFLDVSRIVQEAITNVVKHANATELRLSTQLASEDGRAGVLVEIADDGCGSTTPAPGRGRGLSNMVRRASRLGGTLSFEQLPRGSLVRLWLPLDG